MREREREVLVLVNFQSNIERGTLGKRKKREREYTQTKMAIMNWVFSMNRVNDGFMRADQIDLKSLDEQLQMHLSRAWTMEKKKQEQQQ